MKYRKLWLYFKVDKVCRVTKTPCEKGLHFSTSKWKWMHLKMKSAAPGLGKGAWGGRKSLEDKDFRSAGS